MLNLAPLLPVFSFIALLVSSPLLSSAATDAIINADFVTGDPLYIVGEPVAELAPPPAACVPVPPGLVSWWRGQTNTVDDWDSNHGTSPAPLSPPFFGVTYATGKVGMAFSSAFTVEDSASLRVTTGLTIEAWVNL